MRKLRPAGPWGERVDRLIRANGWQQSELPRHFGLSAKAIRRARYGRGRPPSVKFVLALRALENLYRNELEALDQGLIAARGRSRFVFVDLPEGGILRPADLERSGAVTSLSIIEKAAKPAPISAPARVVSTPSQLPERRRH